MNKDIKTPSSYKTVAMSPKAFELYRDIAHKYGLSKGDIAHEGAKLLLKHLREVNRA